MKKLLGCTVLLLFVCAGTTAQDFDLGDIMGEAQDFFGGAQDEAQKAADNEAMGNFKKKFNEKFENLATDLSSLDMYSPELKCIYLMIKYVENFEEIKKETDNAALCEEKYDLYGMQLMAIASSTTIIYCTEGLFNLLTDNGSRIEGSIFDAPDYMTVLEDYYNVEGDFDNRWYRSESSSYGQRYNKLHEDFQNTLRNYLYREESYTVIPDEEKNKRQLLMRIHARVSDMLFNYFHPLAIIKESMDINKKMSALPCSKG